MSALHDAWTDALPAVLRLVTGQRRGLFRQELQRFLAFSNMDHESAEALMEPLAAMLLQAARAARQPAAISTMRAWSPTRDEMAGLCQHLLAQWRTAEERARGKEDRDLSGMTGEVFFGKRLGGPGRPGALAAEPGPQEGPDE